MSQGLSLKKRKVLSLFVATWRDDVDIKPSSKCTH